MNYFNYIHEYLDKSTPIQCVPVNGKAPFLENWQSIDVTHDIIESWEESLAGKTTGFGIRAGQFNIGWQDIDTDDSELIHRIDEVMDISNICCKKGKKGKTVFFRYKGTPKKSKYNIYLRPGDKKPIVEFNFTSGQTVLPPSIHPEIGVPYKWISNSLLDIDIEELPIIDEAKIEFLEQILRSPSLQEGLKNAPTSVVGDGSGMFNTMKSEVTRLLHLGIEEANIAKTLVGMDIRLFSGRFFFSEKLGKDRISKDNAFENALMWVSTYKNSIMRTDPELRKTLSNVVRVSEATITSNDWGQVKPLLPKKRVTEFPDHLFPDAFRSYCKDLSAQSALPPESYLTALFSSFTATCQARVYIYAMNEFVLHPSISTMIVAPSGSRKDAIFDAATRPLRKLVESQLDFIDENFIENEKNLIAEIEEVSRKIKKAISDNDIECKKQLTQQRIELQKELTTQKKMKPDFIFESGTQEKLYELMHKNQDRGIFLTASEYVLLMGNLSKKGNESLRAFYLKLLNGSTTESFNHQTKTGTNVNTRKVVGCALVGAQTDVLAKDIREMEQGRQSDGLLQRFFMVSVSPEVKRMQKTKVALDSARIDNLFSLMYNHDKQVDVYWENEEAQDCYIDYDENLRKKIEFDKSVIKSFRSKYSGRSVQLAWIYEIGNAKPGTIPTKISKKSLLLAVEFLEWQSRNLDVIWGNVNYGTALRVAELILAGKTGIREKSFLADAQRVTKATSIEIEAAVDLLVENNYLRRTSLGVECNPCQ